MKEQADLFTDEPPAAPAEAIAMAGTALRLSGKDSRLSPAQQRFNRLLARIDKLQGQIAEVQALADAHRPLYHATLGPLRERFQALTRRMALWLDERLQGKGLSPAQKRTGFEILCGLCEALAADGDEAMRALHDKHSRYSLQQKAQAAAADMRAMMEDALGQTIEVDESLDPLDAVMRAGMARMQETAQAEQARRQAARARKKPTAAQRQAEQRQEDAETILRKVYRQLASALHPDREQDPSEHQRKTALMSEANAAYGRQDLMALLHIQLRTEQADPRSFSQLPEEKIESMSLLLKQQALELERELETRRQQVLHEFDLSPHQTPTAARLRTQLLMEEHELKQDLAVMESDLRQVQDDAGLKRWLKIQKQLAKEPVFVDLKDFKL
jgi:hypothetical protein